MKDNSVIPFWGKIKPTRRYVAEHSISYQVSNGKLFCLVTKTTMKPYDTKTPLMKFEVKSKQQLDKLLKVESIDEVRLLNEVVI